ncbi:hypothetical protein [Mameliella alba]|uniref:Hpr(Ser) kinase/phosphatase n=1 Tax=Mameliella alba TaxID=561184 RepID=A0A0B3SHV0_9RHOB|nr:hypothetical protein [Mameliella alba]KHQ50149.1 Hpr(Ser) kinase/phosphatase [Mameliella alba]
MPMKTYFSAGVLLETPIECPSLTLVRGHAGLPTLKVELQDTPAPKIERIPGQPPNWRITHATCELDVPGVAFFRIHKSGLIQTWPRSADTDEIAIFLVGTVLGIALHLRGTIALHASAVQVGDGAVLFCGVSGAGKSTLAAMLHQRGYPVLSDDVSALDLTDGNVVLHSDGRKLKLWKESIKALDLGDARTRKVRKGFNKFYVPMEPPPATPTPVRALYALHRQTETGQPEIASLSAPDAAQIIRLNAYRPRLVTDLGAAPLYFKTAAALLRRASVCRLGREHDFEQQPAVVDLLETHWHDINLLA